MDTKAWIDQLRMTALTGPLNHADFAGNLSQIKQVHLVGTVDQVVPKTIADSYAVHCPPTNRPNVQQLTGYDHVCCWDSNWATLWLGIQQ